MQARKNQHYVWEHYLKAWVCNEQNEVWSSHNGRVGRRPISRIASSEYFYEVKPVNDDEKKYFQLFFLHRYPKDVQDEMLRYIDILNTPFRLNKELNFVNFLVAAKLGGYDKIPEYMRKELEQLKTKNDILAKNIVEERHGEAETQAVKWLNALINKDLDFFDFEKPMVTVNDHLTNEGYNFVLFVCMQYFRTKKTIERHSGALKKSLENPEWNNILPHYKIDIQNIDPENITPHFLRLNEMATAFALWTSKANLTLLMNDTNCPFITSDQPVINLKADYQNRGKEVEGLVFYYPISPHLAITINDLGKLNKVSLDVGRVTEFNKYMLKAHYQNAFADRKDVLENYINNITNDNCTNR